MVAATGAFTWPWVIAGIAVAALLAVVYLPFVLRLPPRVRRWVLTGAGLFLAGALGVEMTGAAIHGRTGGPSPAYLLATNVEEGLEMAGLAALVHALVLQLGLLNGGTRLRVSAVA